MEAFLTFLTYFGHVSNIIVLIAAIVGIWLWSQGILRVLYRLGKGLAKSKIAIFAKADNLSSIKNLLLDSNLFLSKNIIDIPEKRDIGRAEDTSLYLVFWPDWKGEIDDILDCKGDKTALIVYAPQQLGFIPKDKMTDLGEHRNVAVTNFRGRLLNDIVVSIITRSSTR